jgi:hypothetical protein
MRVGWRALSGGRRRGLIGSRRNGRARPVGVALVLVWLIIGVIAGGQRHYYSGSAETCAKSTTITGTILAGPLNYLGVNPKISCKLPRPSK